ncbi:MAG: hypothetical protein JWN55_2862 [Frankiales bacterium]|nr:hypothetical protein [Frankiales bacterium]
MQTRRTGRTRPGRVLPVVVVLVVLGLLAPWASAAGTGGIEVTPVPSLRNGKPVTTFTVEVPTRGSSKVAYTVRNVEKVTRSARVYAAEVTKHDGNFVLGAPGSSPYVAMADRTVTLKAGEIQPGTFTVKSGPGRPKGQAYAAIVVEVRNGSVVQRANTLVYLKPGREIPLPVLVVLVAVAVLGLAGIAFLVVFRRRRTR